MISANTLTIAAAPQPAYLKEIIVEPGRRTPFVKFNGQKGVLIIKGNAIEKDVHIQLISLATLVDEYLKENPKLSCFFFFKDFNCSTCKVLFDLFKTLKGHQNSGRSIRINWFADQENTEMLETGLDYSDLFDLNFNIQPV